MGVPTYNKIDKFKNKYRIPSASYKPGIITNGDMQLNEIGILAENHWLEIPNHFSFIELGNFVIMPNHVHGILIINKPFTDG